MRWLSRRKRCMRGLCRRRTVGRTVARMRSRMSNSILRGPVRGRRGLMRAGMNTRRRLGMVLRRHRMCCYRQWFRLAFRRPMTLLHDRRRDFAMGRRHFSMGRRVPCRYVSLFTRPFIRRMLPPICGARMLMMPDDHAALMPVAIMIEPNAYRPPHTE